MLDVVFFSSFLSSLASCCVLSLLVLDVLSDALLVELEDVLEDVEDELVDELAVLDVDELDVPEGWLGLVVCIAGVLTAVCWITEFSTLTTGLVSAGGSTTGGGAGVTSGGNTG